MSQWESRRLVRAAHWATIVAPFVMLATCLLMALGWYVINPEWRTWVDWWVGRVGLLAAVIIGVVVVLVVCWVLVGLGKWVVRASSRASAGRARSDKWCQVAVRNLSVPALQVLFRALLRYELGASATVRVELSDLAKSWAGTGEGVTLKVVRQACRELKLAGFVKGHSAFGGKGRSGVSVPLADCLRERPSARKVREWCNDQLVDLGVWEN